MNSVQNNTLQKFKYLLKTAYRVKGKSITMI